jgi:hypothetical protein
VSSVVPPSENVTVPVGAVLLSLPTVAVKVTVWPYAEGDGAAVSVVVVGAVVTVCVTVAELAEKLS